MLDQVALGTGIGWLNSWQAEPAAGRADIAVRPLRPVALFDTFTSSGEPATRAATTAQFVKALADSCASLAAVTSAS